MGYRIIVSYRADEHIDNITKYVALELSNPSAASGILLDIEGAYGKLEDMAETFAFCEDPYLAHAGYRKYILPNYDYVILYKVEGKDVRISGVFHMREDYANKL